MSVVVGVERDDAIDALVLEDHLAEFVAQMVLLIIAIKAASAATATELLHAHPPAASVKIATALSVAKELLRVARQQQIMEGDTALTIHVSFASKALLIAQVGRTRQRHFHVKSFTAAAVVATMVLRVT